MNKNIKKWVKLFSKCIMVLIPVWIMCIYCKLSILNFVNEDSLGLLWNNDFTHNENGKYYSTVILGDSIANSAYLPELLSDSTIDLALAGTGVVENYYTLENYLNNNNKAPKDVFISFADYHLAQDDFTWKNSNYVHKLSLKQNYEIYKAILEYADAPLAELTSESYWSDVIMYKLWMPSKYMYSVIKGLEENRKVVNTKTYNETTARIGRHCSISNEVYVPEGDIGYKEYTVSKLQEQYYIRLIQLCAKNSIQLHIVKMPTPSNTFYTDEYVRQINDYYANLASGYSNVDFSWPVQLYDIDQFKDSNHMNNHGALLFTRKIKEMYPDVFSDNTLSLARYLAVDQDIKTEYDLDYINEWIEGFDYTLETTDNYYVVTNNYTEQIVEEGYFENQGEEQKIITGKD